MENVNYFDIFTKYTDQIEAQGASIELIQQIVDEHGVLKRRTLDRYGRYQQAKQSTPILTRTFDGEAAKKINSQIANDFFSEIIDTKVGYMFGIPISYVYDKEADGYEMANDTIKNFVRVNDLDDTNVEIGKFASMTGYDAGLLYIDKEGQERLMRVDPWEAVILSKTEINKPQYAIRYFETWENKQRIEFYDATLRYIYEDGVLIESKSHLFDYCPLFGIPNNAELQGDVDKVLTLIDAYDRTASDMNSEIEQFRLAYMLFIGYEPDEKQIAEMMKTGALWIPSAENGERIEFLVKNLDPKYPDSHLDRLEKNIVRFSRHVNMSEALGSGQVTGPAMKHKLSPLETKSMYFERKHEAAMRYMFKVLGTSWKKKGITFDYTQLDLKYTRNIPANTLEEAQTATTMSAITSKRTALASMSSVPDPDKEMELIAQEAQDILNLDNPNLNDPNIDANGNPINPNKQTG